MNDDERSKTPLLAVEISAGPDDNTTYYKIGYANVTAIEWSWTSGSMAAIQTVQVFKNGQLHSEHPFPNVLGVFYDPDFQEVEP